MKNHLNFCSQDSQDLVRELADMNPMVFDGNLNSECFFCGMKSESLDAHILDHNPDCLWAKAKLKTVQSDWVELEKETNSEKTFQQNCYLPGKNTISLKGTK